jgi:hypothetical protein
MKIKFKIVAVAAMCTMLSMSAYAVETKKGVEELSGSLRALLSQEMTSVESAMKSLHSYLIAGEYDKVSKTATNIHNSFILKQKLTKAQGKELKTKLPPEFVAMDRAFHKQASMLAHAADNKNSELANFYVYKMTESCTSCHSAYAKHRFPSFAAKVAKTSAHH